MRLTFAIVTCAVLLAATAAAQDTEGRGRPGRGGGDRGRFGGGPPMQMMVDRLTQTLSLDEEQQAFLKELMAQQEQRMQERRSTFAALREAEESGDTARAEELRAALGEGQGRDGQRGPGPGPEFTQMFDQLRTVLREDQITQLDEMQARFATRSREMGDAMRMARELPEVLNLSEEQRDQYREIMDDQRSAMREAMQERRRMAEESGEPMEDVAPDFESMRTEFLNRITEILNPEQQQALAAYVEDFDKRRAEGEDGRARDTIDVRALMRAVQRLELTDEQKDEIRDVTQAAMRADRELNRRDAEGKAALVAETKRNILEVLTPEQAEQFEKNLAANSRGGRDRAERRGDDQRRDGEQGESRRPRRGRDGD